MPDVKDGDCIASIAETLGIRKFKTLWDANETLKESRSNPNQLVVGDVVEEPKKGTKKETRAKGARYTVEVVPKDNSVSLLVMALDADGQPLKNAQWTMTEPAKSGNTGDTGMIEIEDFPVAEKAATLKVTPAAAVAAAAQPAAAVATTPPPYPAPIKADDFKDKLRDHDPGDDFVEWSLKIGSMPSHNHKSGVMARLQNLGAPIDDGDRLERSVKSYQKAHLSQNDGSGKWEDIQTDLRDRHDTKAGKP